jgi:beta-lactamase class C
MLLAGSAAFALKQNKVDEAYRLIDAQTVAGDVTAAALLVERGSVIFERAFGRAKNTEGVFLLASITKPMTAAALMTLVDAREVSLSDRVNRFIPEFRGDGRERVLVSHLLTHTSGLPDMLPVDVELRKRHAPLSEFVEGACRAPLQFEPGTEVRYQSMGFLLAAEIASRVSTKAFPAFLDEQVFQPLGMRNTSLGLGGRRISETMQCQVKAPSDWDWNSSYWRNLGAPWGGAHSTTGDVSLFLRYFSHPNGRVVSRSSAIAMISDQTKGLNQKWGLGWMLNNGQFGKGCSIGTFGHSGSTGTLCWLDPQNDLCFVLLTTKPALESEKTLLSPVSELVSGAA